MCAHSYKLHQLQKTFTI